jgi:hypothetical protein
MKSKTNLGGLLSTIGMSLSGGGILAQLSQIFPAAHAIPNGVLIACWYIAVAGLLLKIVGSAMVAYYAADDADLQAVKDAFHLHPGVPSEVPNPQPPVPPTIPKP